MKIKYNILDINAYDFYIKEKRERLLNEGWCPLSYKDEDSGLYIIKELYRDGIKNKVQILCKLIWYGETEPVRIEVRTESGLTYSTFFREKYDSSPYIKYLHKGILKHISNFNTIAKKKG